MVSEKLTKQLQAMQLQGTYHKWWCHHSH